MKNNPGAVRLIETVFKYKGTNYSQVAKEMGMSRQTLFRMVKNETLKLSTFLKIMDILGLRLKILDEDGANVSDMQDIQGGRIKKKIKGTVYDTEKMFFVACYEKDDGSKEELCLEPKSMTYLMIRHYVGKRPVFEIVSKDEATKFLEEHAR